MRPGHFFLLVLSLFALPLLAGCGVPSFLITPVSSTGELKEDVVQPGKGFFAPKVAIIEVEGLLANAKSGGLLQPTENSLSLFTQQLEFAERDPAVKAIILRVNSPGGTVSASDAMYQTLLRFRARTGKPIVASIQEVGASGAFYLSCAADQIVAQPTSIVGSIGVIFESIEFSGTLDKIGAHAWAITSAPLKEMGSPFKPLEKSERVIMQQMVDEYFARFVGIVESRRKHLTEPLKTDLGDYKKEGYDGIFSGRVFSGAEAERLGLIDKTGLLEDAIELAKSLGNAKNAAVVIFRRPYGYSGSIYASSTTPAPKSDVTTIDLPGARAFVPAGFYFLWRPGI